MRAHLLVHRIHHLYTLDPGRGGLGLIEDASVGFAEGRIVYMGPSAHAPYADSVLDGRKRVGLPGLVDCHTHAVWAGSRADEFRRRLAGENYTDILQAGGGILSTVRATRAASEKTLTELCNKRLHGMLTRGITTAEVKSGYGLDPQTEARLLRAASGSRSGVRVSPTFLGAHTVPAEHRSDRSAYVRQVIEEQLPLCAPLARQIDVYCDRGAFDLDEAVTILQAGKAAGLRLRAHAEQVSHTGIAAAAARMGADAVDHLEQASDDDVAEMAAHGTVAVLLPGAQLYLRDPSPPVEAFREAGVPMAVASDLNPGTSPVHDLWTIATLACIRQGLTLEEALTGVTRNAGRALGRPELGWLGEGSAADLALMAPPPGEPAIFASLIQHIGASRAVAVIRDGERVQ